MYCEDPFDTSNQIGHIIIDFGFLEGFYYMHRYYISRSNTLSNAEYFVLAEF